MSNKEVLTDGDDVNFDLINDQIIQRMRMEALEVIESVTL